MSKIRYREIYDPMDEIIGQFLSGAEKHPTEDDIIHAIDIKYSKIHREVLYLRRQKYKPQQIMKILHIGEMAYKKAIERLKYNGDWKEYKMAGVKEERK